MDGVANLTNLAALICSWQSISRSVSQYDEFYYAIEDKRKEEKRTNHILGNTRLRKVEQNFFLKVNVNVQYESSSVS